HTVCSFSAGLILPLDIKYAPFQAEQEFIISLVYLEGSISKSGMVFLFSYDSEREIGARGFLKDKSPYYSGPWMAHGRSTQTLCLKTRRRI
ncbi:MAG: hypothetical protein IJ133_03725, partial [Clostridia bacterium]|nr:hypothetical protein [Clostridia bacterium]